MTATETTPQTATTADLLHHLADLDGLMAEAYGDHPALADVRRQISIEVDRTLDELRVRGVEIDAF